MNYKVIRIISFKHTFSSKNSYLNIRILNLTSFTSRIIVRFESYSSTIHIKSNMINVNMIHPGERRHLKIVIIKNLYASRTLSRKEHKTNTINLMFRKRTKRLRNQDIQVQMERRCTNYYYFLYNSFTYKPRSR